MNGAATDFDIVVANPPFRHEKKHIAQMLKVLRHGGILLCISSPRLYNDQKWQESMDKACSVWGIREQYADKDNPIFDGTNSGCCVIAARKKDGTIPVETVTAPAVAPPSANPQLSIFQQSNL